MGNFFNMDNPLFTFLSKVCDILFLSIVWFLICIPIITIGPATTALYYATVKVIRRERGYLFREFFKSFRMNFKKGALVGVILTIIYMILFFDLIWAWEAWGINSGSGSILFGVFVALTFFVLCFTVYVFPILSRFDMKIKQLIKAAIFMSVKHLPSTLGMVIIMAIAVVAAYLIPILVFVVPVIATLLLSLLMERVLKKYMPESEGDNEQSGKDEWYLE